MVAERAGQMVTFLGVAGVGKSRIVQELDDWERPPWEPLSGVTAAPAYRDGITFAPVADMLRTAVGSAPGDRAESSSGANWQEPLRAWRVTTTSAAGWSRLSGLCPPRPERRIRTR